jgi:hypothetical protein
MTKLQDMGHAELAAYLKERELDGIDKQLKVINGRLADFEPLIELKGRLEGARRALLNDRAVASGGGRGLTQSEVVNALREMGEPSSVYEIAQKLGTNEATVRGHLNRGKDERFKKNGDNKWSLREPENDEEEDDE